MERLILHLLYHRVDESIQTEPLPNLLIPPPILIFPDPLGQQFAKYILHLRNTYAEGYDANDYIQSFASVLKQAAWLLVSPLLNTYYRVYAQNKR